MFSKNIKENFNEKEFHIENLLINSKTKLIYMNELNWIKYLVLEIALFQLIFFGMFSFYSITLVLFKLFLCYKIHKSLSTFRIYETSEIDEISCNIYSLTNFVQLMFLLNIIDALLNLLNFFRPIGYHEFLKGQHHLKFFYILVIISIIKCCVIYLVKYKIQKLHMRTEIDIQ